jgi:hypothetical protein
MSPRVGFVFLPAGANGQIAALYPTNGSVSDILYFDLEAIAT